MSATDATLAGLLALVFPGALVLDWLYVRLSMWWRGRNPAPPRRERAGPEPWDLLTEDERRELRRWHGN